MTSHFALWSATLFMIVASKQFQPRRTKNDSRQTRVLEYRRKEGPNMSIRWSLMLMVLLVAPAGHAQDRAVRMECDDNRWGWHAGASFCEIREISVGATRALSVNAGPYGSIRVSGESRRDLQVRVRVQTWGNDRAEAETIAREVIVHSDDGLRAEGPSQDSRAGWSVSYDVLAPREIDLSLETENGGISVADIRGDLALEAHNGGISVDGVAGNVRGRTTNGGVDATLSGRKWEGAGLDLQTTNGGVRLRVPGDYSARLETGTVNGRVDIDFPVTVQGRFGREISRTLGKGGALVRAATTNGAVRVTRQ